jgi:hypothetical protein
MRVARVGLAGRARRGRKASSVRPRPTTDGARRRERPQRRAARKSGRGAALLTGLVRCGRCECMMRVFYGMRSGPAHRYQCRGDEAHVGSALCTGIGGIRVDRAIVERILVALADPTTDAALLAADQTVKGGRRRSARGWTRARGRTQRCWLGSSTLCRHGRPALELTDTATAWWG